MTKWDSSQGCKDGTIFANQQHSTSNKTKNKNHIIISIDAEKAFENIQQSFMIKNAQQSGNRGSIPQIIKTTYDKLTTNIILNR